MTFEDFNASIDEEHGLTFAQPELPPEYRPWPVECLPEPLRSLVEDGTEALQCDPVLIVQPMLSTIGAAIGNARHMTVKSGWNVPPMLWTVSLAHSGSSKTPAMSLAKRPLEDIEHEVCTLFDRLDAEYMEADEAFKNDLKQWSKKKEGERPESPTPPHPKRHIVKDTTLPGLVEILKDNSRGLLVPVDELAGWFASFNQYDKGGGDAEKWISIYSAESISVDRKGNKNERGVMRPVKVYRPFVALTGGLQPGLWAKVMTADQQHSGMAARFLMAWPPQRPKRWTDATVSESTKEQYAKLIADLVCLEAETTDTGQDRPKYVGMDADAKRLYQTWYDKHNQEHVERSGSIAAASSKIEEIPIRVGLILHCVKVATGEARIDRIDGDTMQTAILIANWHMAESERIYSIMETEMLTRPYRELADWIRSKGGTINTSELIAGRRKIKNAGEAEAALNALVHRGYGKWESAPPKKTGGTASRKFVLTGISVSVTPANPKENDSCADADIADTKKTQPNKRVDL